MSGRPGEFPTVSRCAPDYAKETGSRCSCRRRWSTSTRSSGCSRRASYPSPWIPGSRRSSASGSWPASPPHCWSRRSNSCRNCGQPIPTSAGCPGPGRCTARAAPPGRRRACGPACSTTRRHRARGRGAVAWGFAAGDVNLVCRRSTTRRRCGSRSERCWPAGGWSSLDQFDPALFTKAIERQQPTTVFCVPTHLQRLFAHGTRSVRRTCRRSGSSRTPGRRARTR